MLYPNAVDTPIIRWSGTFFESWRVFSAQLGIMLPIALLTIAPLDALPVAMETLAPRDELSQALGTIFLLLPSTFILSIGPIAIARAAEVFKTSGERLSLLESLRWGWRRWAAVNWTTLSLMGRGLLLFAAPGMLASTVFSGIPALNLMSRIAIMLMAAAYGLRRGFSLPVSALRGVKGGEALEYAVNIYQHAPGGTVLLYIFGNFSPWAYGWVLRLPALLLDPSLSMAMKWMAVPFEAMLTALILVMQSILFIAIDQSMPPKMATSEPALTADLNDPGI